VGASELIVARLFAGDDVGPVLEMPGELVSLVLDGVRAPGLVASTQVATPKAPTAKRAPASKAAKKAKPQPKRSPVTKKKKK
jgi:hypothetical protein